MSPSFKLKKIMLPLLIFAILFPPIRLPFGIPAVRIEMILFIIVWVFLFLYYSSDGLTIKFYKLNVMKWFALFAFSIVLSTVYGAFFLDQILSGRDFFEPFKLLLLLLVFVFISNTHFSIQELDRIYKYSLIIFICSALFGFTQYLNIANINDWITPYYAPAHQMRGLLVHGRIVGTTANPNQFGAMMVLASSLAFSGALFFKKNKLRFFAWICLGVFMLALVLTLSRSAALSLVVALTFIYFIRYPSTMGIGRFIKKFIPICFLLTIIVYILMQIAPDTVWARLSGILEVAEQTSWQARVRMWEYHYDLWLKSPILGWGPAKETMGTIVDNEWLYLSRRYGIIGVTIFLFWWFSFYRGLVYVMKRADSDVTIVLSIALQATLIAFAVFMLASAIYHDLQIMPLLMLFLGLTYTQLRKAKNNNHMTGGLEDRKG